MSNFREEIKTQTKEQKNIIYLRILKKYINMAAIQGEFLSKKDLIKNLTNYETHELSPDEITALSSIIGEFHLFAIDQTSYSARNENKKRFINAIYGNSEIKTKNALDIINATIADVKKFKKFNRQGAEYIFNFGHIIEIMKGEDPYIDFMAEEEAQKRRNKFKIVE